ncbi:MAG: nucleotidyltransferase family protein [Candidatus Micrarchaeaceae archaeon]
MGSVKAFPKSAIIIAGGEGTRLRPLTLETPKPLVPLFGKPVIQYIIEELDRQGVKEAILAIGYKAEKIQEYFEEHKDSIPLSISYSLEKEKLDTGGALKLALKQAHSGRDFFVINGDSLFKMDLAGMYRRHKANNAVITIAVIEATEVSGSGVVKINGEKVESFVEKPDPKKAQSHFINCGIYVVSREIEGFFPAKDSFSLERDVFEKLAAKGAIYAYRANVFYTVNNHEQYEEAKEAIRQHKLW